MKTSLRTLKRIGGEWRTDNHPAVDGDKYVCMDRIISSSPCLIYSYGIRDDWTFEDYMAEEHRCTVWAHDHTVQYPNKRGDNIHFLQQGLGIGQNLDTLNNFIERNGHKDTVIEYLKVCIGL